MGMPVTVKGQVTIPKAIRDRLGLTPGSRVAFDIDPDGQVVLRKAEEPAVPADDPLDRLIGCGTALKGMTTDEIMQLLRGDDDSDL
ncbi:AbrB/MazE/SpoVT family DNA-binding domain-containing protein [Paracraurococcus lichenis]|uniref:Type II toxin-antitoxin system PrlF family antitoxin n=1 Tax=Paracraurococcus lichenis TaxID=3064888 RepID=A0ABT9E3J4_9PROT|nr:type II toxin-antitoxin system PrlF family antitoxin [Paracraurococcus sp. LOR1-02]MDO9710731.1 type II toxin-antitoxin system PrlF family antitoxin [Paracraurococcus sp. LOR1-02]